MIQTGRPVFKWKLSKMISVSVIKITRRNQSRQSMSKKYLSSLRVADTYLATVNQALQSVLSKRRLPEHLRRSAHADLGVL